MKTLITELFSMPIVTEILSTAGEKGTAAISGLAHVDGSESSVAITALFTANNIWIAGYSTGLYYAPGICLC